MQRKKNDAQYFQKHQEIDFYLINKKNVNFNGERAKRQL